MRPRLRPRGLAHILTRSWYRLDRRRRAPDHPVAVENRLPGSANSWLDGTNGTLVADDKNLQVKGFASATSVAVGESLDFHVTVAGEEEFRVGIYRLGWYGGKGARKVVESPWLRGVAQPPPEHDPETGLITCPWSVSWTLSVGSDWVSGLYVAVFTTASGWRNYTPFVVRNPEHQAALCVVIPSTTYQAHNQWPMDGRLGRSLYYGYAPDGHLSYEHRALEVSFDRPYADSGLPGHWIYDQEFIQWAESEDFDLTYVDSVDLHAGRVDPERYRGFVFCGYDAYWSSSMRSLAERAVAAGTSLVVLSTCPGYWHMRMRPSAEGRADRIMACYKSTPDPGPGPATGLWREAPPAPLAPEQRLFGIQYLDSATRPVPLVVQNADHWFWQGTGVVDGDQVEGVVGGPADTHYPTLPGPADSTQTLLAASPFPGSSGAEHVHNTSICEFANGAVVFVAGSLHWPLALAPYDRGEPSIRAATANLLNRVVHGTVARARRPERVAPPAVARNRIAEENARPGSAGWLLGMDGTLVADDKNLQVKGFASATSVAVGESLDFHVTVAGEEEFRVGIYRLGWYGGKGARKVVESPWLRGVAQPPPEHDPETGLITCPWSVSWTLSVGSDWVSGLYVAVFTTASGWRNYTPFVVRDPAQRADLCVVVGTTTYQAYNQWPWDERLGRSLYNGFEPGTGRNPFELRARHVSFDRPYMTTGLPTGFEFDRDAVRWLEREGLDLTYVDSLDLHSGRVDPSRYRGLVFISHDEYWSASMRSVVERAVEGGTSLAFLSANSIYWNIRVLPASDGRPDRVIVCYKGEDPQPDDSGHTIKWRNPAPGPGRPEQEFLGVQFNGVVIEPVPLVVQRADHWFWRGVGVVDGRELDGVVGGEADGFDPGYPSPQRGTRVLLSASPYRYTEPDSTLATPESPFLTQNTSVWEADNGAIIFVAASLHYPAALGRVGRVDPHIQAATRNVINRIVRGR